MVVKSMHESSSKRQVISILNQVRIYKEMILLCELVGFFGKKKREKLEMRRK